MQLIKLFMPRRLSPELPRNIAWNEGDLPLPCTDTWSEGEGSERQPGLGF